jgi:hypothetical protein
LAEGFAAIGFATGGVRTIGFNAAAGRIAPFAPPSWPDGGLGRRERVRGRGYGGVRRPDSGRP